MINSKAFIWLILLVFYSCVSEEANLALEGKSPINHAHVSKLTVKENKIIISGKNLEGVKQIRVSGQNGFNKGFSITENSGSEIIALAKEKVAFIMGKAFELVLSNAHGSIAFPVSFELQDGAITAEMLGDMGASAGDVLIYDGTQWRARAGTGYAGSASLNLPMANYEVNNAGGTGQDQPQLIVSEGYRSHNGVKFRLPAMTLVGAPNAGAFYNTSEFSEATGAHKFIYFYVLPSDPTKVVVSDTAPSEESVRTIAGREYVYLGAARYYSDGGANARYTAAKSSLNKVWFNERPRSMGYSNRHKGLEFLKQDRTCSDTSTVNLEDYLPATYADVRFAYKVHAKVRCDSGCFSRITNYVRDPGGNFLTRDQAWAYIDTPIGSNYYPVPYDEFQFVETSKGMYDLTSLEFSFTATTCVSDGWSGHKGVLINYTDKFIF